ncbi:Hypothetical protein CINCED_3A008122 [Cinara cedri]|uniref:Uncharacterized protein n=1 Tax=Cinara cedri TaxID=506608 RepID=A0A5E4MA50_9HEMI|nr:Hypothetical protein CINCED_3A008122 [Cinara cedri]
MEESAVISIEETTVVSPKESTVIAIDTLTVLLPYVGDAPEAGNSRVADGHDAMCPPDGSFCLVFTCVLGFAATMILDGVCLSLFLYDSNVVMAEQLLSSSLSALEHLSVVWL